MARFRSHSSRPRRQGGPAAAEPPRAEEALGKALEEAALRHLARYATSAENLRRVLMRRLARAAPARGRGETHAKKEIESLLARFRSAGLLNDRGYAEGVVRTQRRRGASGPAIRARLAAKGVDRQTIDAVLAGLAADQQGRDAAELAAACRLVRRRRLGPYRDPRVRGAHRDKDLAALSRAGFTREVAARVLRARDGDEIEALIADLSR